MCIRSCDALLSMLLDLGKCKSCCSCFGSWRHPDPHPDVVFSSKWFSHLNAYASTCALHPNEYPNLARRWRSISNKAIQSEVQLAGTCAYAVATHFSRCCSIWESANLVAVALFHGGTLILIQTWFSHINA